MKNKKHTDFCPSYKDKIIALGFTLSNNYVQVESFIYTMGKSLYVYIMDIFINIGHIQFK